MSTIRSSARAQHLPTCPPPSATVEPAGLPSPEPAAPGLCQLVAGHDGRLGSDVALRTAAELAGLLNAHLHVVHSVTITDWPLDPDSMDWEEQLDATLVRERAHVTEVLRGAAPSWTYHQERGDPARRLAELADEVGAQFIVIGASHRGMLRHLLDGGLVSGRLTRLQSRPVLVVPEP